MTPVATYAVRMQRNLQRVGEAAGIAADLVTFHERVGRKAPRTAGKNLSGGTDDPASQVEPWQLYLFIDGDTDSSYQLRRHVDELRGEDYRGKIRLVCVTFASSPVAAATALNELVGGKDVCLLYTSPSPRD